jgi:hypothetical protein
MRIRATITRNGDGLYTRYVVAEALSQACWPPGY